MMKPTCLLEKFPDVWTQKGLTSMASNYVPIMVVLKPGSCPVRQRQYSVPQEVRLGISVHLQCLKVAGILVECQSSWKTPLLPIKKAGRNDG
jgi:hypothetical protein